MDDSGTDYCYTKHTITFEGIVHAQSKTATDLTSAPCFILPDSMDGAAGRDSGRHHGERPIQAFSAAADACGVRGRNDPLFLRSLLGRPGHCRRQYHQDGHPVTAKRPPCLPSRPAAITTRRATTARSPRKCSIKQIASDKVFRVTFKIECARVEFGTPSRNKSLQGVLNNRWGVTEAMDANFFTTRTIHGKMLLNSLRAIGLDLSVRRRAAAGKPVPPRGDGVRHATQRPGGRVHDHGQADPLGPSLAGHENGGDAFGRRGRGRPERHRRLLHQAGRAARRRQARPAAPGPTDNVPPAEAHRPGQGGNQRPVRAQRTSPSSSTSARSMPSRSGPGSGTRPRQLGRLRRCLQRHDRHAAGKSRIIKGNSYNRFINPTPELFGRDFNGVRDPATRVLLSCYLQTPPGEHRIGTLPTAPAGRQRPMCRAALSCPVANTPTAGLSYHPLHALVVLVLVGKRSSPRPIRRMPSRPPTAMRR